MARQLIADPKEEERGCYRLLAEIDGKQMEAMISEVALLELGCREADAPAAFIAEHQGVIEDVIRAARAKRPGPPVRIWADDVRHRETAAAGGLGGPPTAWK